MNEMTELKLEEIEAVSGAGFWSDFGAFMAEFANDTNCGKYPPEMFNRARALL